MYPSPISTHTAELCFTPLRIKFFSPSSFVMLRRSQMLRS
jgi:hypothetical protein